MRILEQLGGGIVKGPTAVESTLASSFVRERRAQHLSRDHPPCSSRLLPYMYGMYVPSSGLRVSLSYPSIRSDLFSYLDSSSPSSSYPYAPSPPHPTMHEPVNPIR